MSRTQEAAGDALAAPCPPPPDSAPRVEWPLWYATVLGWPVFPVFGMQERDGVLVCSCGGCKNPGKHPITDHGFQDATTDPDVIRAWWAAHPDANIGTPYPSVLDCDLPRASDPADGVAEFRKLEKKHGIVAGAAIARSGGGGLHVFFAPGAEAGKVGPGLSMRGEGNYAVLPPSVHESGKRYVWERPPLAGRLLPAQPDSLRKQQTAATKKLKAKVFGSAEKIPVNERHDAIAAYIGGLRRRNPALTAGEALVLAHAFRVERCEAPEEKVRDVDDLVAYVYEKDPPTGDAPWQGPVPDGARLLDALVAYLRRFMRMSEHEFAVVALYVVLTYAVVLFEILGYLRVFSATKRCGKSRLLDILELLVHAPLSSGGMSEPALFRSLAERPRTLLLDEVGRVLGEAQRDRNSDLARVFLNGYAVGRPVQRCVGQGANQTVVDFPVFGAKLLVGVGRLDDQILDRCFSIELQRKRRDEPVQRFRRRRAVEETAELRAQAAAWVDAHADNLRDARPTLPVELDDRGQDISEPLLAIADLAGGDWPKRARAAVVALRGGSAELEEDIGVELLADIREAFGSEERLATDELLRRLTADSERPWATWAKGNPINAMQLARRLRGFGVKPKQLKIAGVNQRGYERADFSDAFSRYAPSNASVPATAATSGQPNQEQLESTRYPRDAGSGLKDDEDQQKHWEVAGVAGPTRETGVKKETGGSNGASPAPLTPEQDAALDAYFAQHGDDV